MNYVGIQTQINRNNRNSILLLLSFPCIILGTVWVFLALTTGFETVGYDEYGYSQSAFNVDIVNQYWVSTIPYVIIGVGIWFTIAYLFNTKMIQSSTGARPLTRKENPRIYNIVENLCMAGGMDMPQINVVDDPQLNAFASGINKDSYTVTVTTGICDRLNDEELAGVIGHELTHIRNRDTKVLITSIIFVGIISTVLTLLTRFLYRTFLYGGFRTSSNSSKKNGGGAISLMAAILVAIVCTAIAYFFTLLTRFAISRKREFMADAGGAELCGNPRALASALRKISEDPGLNHVERDDVAQLFIIHPSKLKQSFLSGLNSLFATHPDTAERIRILEQF
ncbi:MAG: M48 family metallopeptidase [Bacteroidaceae bacterium]|nr:M48 family metallopeptidase [Bacteroidaceae bacterium]